MSNIIDKYSPQTPITQDGKLASNWLQSWLSKLQEAIDPSWRAWVPTVSGATLNSVNIANYRQRGNNVDVSLQIGITAPANITSISIALPIGGSGLGVLPSVYTTDLTNYLTNTAFYDGSVTAKITIQTGTGAPWTGGVPFQVSVTGSFRLF